MILTSREEQKKEAFRLFEDGRYIESGQLCTIILKSEKDPAIEVLAATNLYYTGKLDDAEVFFRDLEKKMPDSSYVHSYLAKVLEARGDEGAIAEYATAVHLDPSNQDALRSYAEYLLAHMDYRAALPVFKRLVQTGKKPADVRHLMQALLGIGEAAEALSTHAELGAGTVPGHEYIDALVKTGNFPAAAESALRIYKETRDPAVLRKYLSALSCYDLPASIGAYADHIQSVADCEILFDYVLLLQANGRYAEALDAARALLKRSRQSLYRLLECDLLAAPGAGGDGGKSALAAYEHLIRDELGTKNDLDLLRLIIGRYRQHLNTCVPADEAVRRFLDLVSKDVNVSSLLETALLYDEAGNAGEAKSWYYRAYRADFLTGGLAYAQFLDAHGEGRECEKVMLYILSNVKKSADLSRVAAVIVDSHSTMHRLKRLMDGLIKKLEARRATLDSGGLELLSMAFFIAGTNAHNDEDYAACKYYCLCGLDVMPAHTRAIHPEDFLGLIRACKERSIADRPIMNVPQAQRKPAAAGPPAQLITGQLGLTEQESRILDFIRLHRTASEMELRKVLGTRRVVGIVNCLIQKAAAQGLLLIAKKGVGEDGETYEYTGT